MLLREARVTYTSRRIDLKRKSLKGSQEAEMMDQVTMEKDLLAEMEGLIDG